MPDKKPNSLMDKIPDKKWILIILAAIIIIGALAYILTPKVDTALIAYGSDPINNHTKYGSINIALSYNETNSSGNYTHYLQNKTVFVNLTDSNNITKEYNVTTNGSDDEIDDVKVGKYNLTAYFPGDTTYKSSSYNTTITIKKYKPRNNTYYTFSTYPYYSSSPSYYWRNGTYYTYQPQTRYIVRYVYV